VKRQVCSSMLALLLLLVVAPGRGGATQRCESSDSWTLGCKTDTSDTSAGETSPGTAAESPWSLLRPANRDAGWRFERAPVRLDDASTLQLAQVAGKGEREGAAPEEDAQQKASLTEINKQLSNPVTSFWSLTFQFNNYSLENGHWNHNMQFQPVLPISLTKELNLINRPVIPVYNSVPHPVPGAPGHLRQTTGFGDLADVELLSPPAGPWLLALGPAFIFPTGSKYTGQGKYQIGPAAVLGYLAKDFIAGVFPQAWWSVSGGSRPAVAQLNIQPFASVFFGEGWSFGYSGNILANLHASTGQMWTVPLGLSLAKVVKLGPLPVRLALSPQWMPVRPSDFGQEYNIQLIIAPVIPKLFGGTVF
jgi:hypothetical protein